MKDILSWIRSLFTYLHVKTSKKTAETSSRVPRGSAIHSLLSQSDEELDTLVAAAAVHIVALMHQS